MSSLNLEPNPTIMAVQAGLFVMNFVAVKKLFLDPYLKVYDKRQNLTVGSQSEAKELASKNETVFSQIQSTLQEANEEAGKIRDNVNRIALEKRSELVSQAEVEAKNLVSKIESEIAEVKSEERPKIPQIIEQLSESIFTQIIEA